MISLFRLGGRVQHVSNEIEHVFIVKPYRIGVYLIIKRLIVVISSSIEPRSSSSRLSNGQDNRVIELVGASFVAQARKTDEPVKASFTLSSVKRYVALSSLVSQVMGTVMNDEYREMIWRDEDSEKSPLTRSSMYFIYFSF